MEHRGASRPEHGGEHGDGHEHGDHGMTREQRMHMLHAHHAKTLWVYWTLVILGFWMVFAPLTFDYGRGAVQPSGGREVWLTLSQRIAAMTWSDIISGALLVVFGWRSLTPNRPVSLWICCFVGIWLTCAPIVFWAPHAVAYLNATVVGALVIALSVLIPGMPNMILYMQMGEMTPPGWSYNPSSWPQRWILIALSLGGWIVSRYLAAFQLGYLPRAWDPFFGGGSERVLNSDMSHMWPISDAALGAAAYTFEFLMGFMGSGARWRTMPWMVTLFGILVIPLGLTHILLVISQPVVVGEWCTLCLLAALFMLPMIPLEVDEVVAMGQHLVESHRRGESVWHTFWKGGSAQGTQPDERTPPLVQLPQKPVALLRASIWGMSYPLSLALSTLLGVYLMFTPLLFGMDKPASDIAHVGGALVITVSVIAMGEPLRVLRYLNVLLAIAVAVVPWFLQGNTAAGGTSNVLVALALIVLAVPRGRKEERFGLWERYVF